MEELGSDVQALSHRLHSSRLEYLGLTAAAAGFCRELSDSHGVDIDFHSENIPIELLPKEISLCLFRVLQEALQNAIKHSGSRHFQASVFGGPTAIELTVHDSGIGFDPGEATKGRGLGFTSMKERLKLVNGTLSIDSQPRRGTTKQACERCHGGQNPHAPRLQWEEVAILPTQSKPESSPSIARLPRGALRPAVRTAVALANRAN